MKMESAIWMNKDASSRYIKENRARLNISQIELAKRIGVAPNTVYLWERGTNLPNKSARLALESEFSKKFVKGVSKKKQGERKDLPKVANPVPKMPPRRETEEEIKVELSAWMLFAIVVVSVAAIAVFAMQA
ncbi:MAG: helix-turn-helix domain-containing protein [Pseudomonadales bacterium]